MTKVFLGLGSNVGNREAYLQKALSHIEGLPGTKILERSDVYETEPVGEKNQADFLNSVVEISTDCSPRELHQRLKEIEVSVGRTAGPRWGPREIDIDILYFGALILKTDDLQIPHPERSRRRFVLEPLAKLAPDFCDPESGKTMPAMLEACPDHSSVRKTVDHHH